MKNLKREILFTLLFITIGIAVVTTNVVVNMSTPIASNTDDFLVYFSDVKVNGTQDLSLVRNEKQLVFAGEFSAVGDKKVISYDVTNASQNYDANITINCTKSNDYLIINNSFDTDNVLGARSTRTGTLSVELKNAVSEEILQDVTCTIEANAVERTSIVFNSAFNPGLISSTIKREVLFNSGNAKLYNGLGSDDFENDVYYFTNQASNVNVIFGGFCWKIIRTTDTGGTKMIYNGIPTNGKCDNSGESTYIEKIGFNSSRTSLAYVGYMYNAVYPNKYKYLYGSSNSYLFAKSYSYDELTNTYILSDTKTSTWDAIYKSLGEYRYTCFDTVGKCTDVNYIYHSSQFYPFYLVLNGGESGNDALNKMLYADDVNETDSQIKSAIDTWFENKLLSKKDYLEDTVYCNDRRIFSMGSLDYINNTATSDLEFYSSAYTDLTCENLNDRFTVDSDAGNKKLKYPVGLITAAEVNLIGEELASSGVEYATMSPYKGIDEIVSSFVVSSGGSLTTDGGVSYVRGVRPVISLKPDVTYISGSGLVDDPYVIDES